MSVLSVPRCPHLQNGHNHSLYLQGQLAGLNRKTRSHPNITDLFLELRSAARASLGRSAPRGLHPISTGTSGQPRALSPNGSGWASSAPFVQAEFHFSPS